MALLCKIIALGIMYFQFCFVIHFSEQSQRKRRIMLTKNVSWASALKKHAYFRFSFVDLTVGLIFGDGFWG
ncbi:hypothetical protein AC478_02680 [miscellaneous Crenarchaeota group-1 archaeon SG8-32-3]|uniref:Uncharacterized protein n=1 Tax=miscellaneous Crenarchaeota group-1 archaeon SG8-32-3 TaxID=1685125 RepID=A0A0M0BSH6_9ARCH|nr:MAG: hypothetical protein AC478_02680 [miscellaneous Crenarchaeota group-1 archaeon SG8-32-3]